MTMNQRQIAYCGDSIALTRTVHGDKIYVDTEDTVCSPHVLLDGNWEGWISGFLRAYGVRPGDCCADVGAHIGWYTLLFARIAGPSGKVHSFEPNRRLCRLLERTLMINGLLDRVDLYNAAASSQLTWCDLETPPYASGNGRLSFLEPFPRPKETAPLPRPVDLAYFDEPQKTPYDTAVPLDALELDIDFLKVDAEGHESHVLRGAMETIKRRPRIKLLVEHHGSEIAEGAALEAERKVFEELCALGFRMAVVNHSAMLEELTLGDLDALPDSEMIYLCR